MSLGTVIVLDIKFSGLLKFAEKLPVQYPENSNISSLSGPIAHMYLYLYNRLTAMVTHSVNPCMCCANVWTFVYDTNVS